MDAGGESRGQWSSKIGFIFAAAGSAIGLGNIWRFPYMAGENGGAAFVLLYLVFVVLIGAPVMIAELTIGRRTNQNPVGAFDVLVPKTAWRLIGMLGICTGVGILSFYAVVAGWTLNYSVKSIVTPGYISVSETEADSLWNQFTTDPKNSESNKRSFLQQNDLYPGAVDESVTGERLEQVWAEAQQKPAFQEARTKKLRELHMGRIFVEFTSSPSLSLLYMFLFMLLTMSVVAGGVSGGIERWSKILMPVFMVLLILLVIRSVTLGGAGAGLNFYLKPDFSKVGIETAAQALGQALFSLSLGMGTMITYGSYLSRKEDLAVSASYICLFDTIVAILAGFAIFPALFAQGLNPAGGPGLVFVVFPTIFETMFGGKIFGAVFFFLLTVAALTSTISLLEVPVAYFVDSKNWSRKKAVLAVGLFTSLVGVPSALSIGASDMLSNFLGIGFLGFMNAAFGNYALTIGAFFISVFVGYRWGLSASKSEVEASGHKFKLSNAYSFLIRFICPIAVFAIFAYIAITGKYF